MKFDVLVSVFIKCEQSRNHISLKKAGLDVIHSHRTHASLSDNYFTTMYMLYMRRDNMLT